MRQLRKSALLLSLWLLNSCSWRPLGQGPELQAGEGYLLPSQLNEQRDEHDGKRVVVRGWMRASFENYGIWDSGASEQRGEAAFACVSLLVPNAWDTSLWDRSLVQLEGTFLKKLPENTIFLGGCSYATLMLDIDHPPKRLDRN